MTSNAGYTLCVNYHEKGAKTQRDLNLEFQMLVALRVITTSE